jgi:hypothetical protein
MGLPSPFVFSGNPRRPKGTAAGHDGIGVSAADAGDFLGRRVKHGLDIGLLTGREA